MELEKVTIYITKVGRFESVCKYDIVLPSRISRDAWDAIVIEDARQRGYYWRRGFNIGAGFEDGSLAQIRFGLPPEHPYRAVG